MSELWNIRFVGTLETLTPLCVVAPGADEIILPNKVTKYKRITHRTLYSGSDRATKPVLPGSTIRGRLRRSAVEVVLGLAGETIPLAEWHQNAVGGIKGSASESGHDILMRQALREKNPVLGLFGAGSPWMLSRASIGDAVPVDHVVTEIIGGVRADDGNRDNAFFEKLDDSAPEEWLALKEDNATRTQTKAKLREINAAIRAARKAKNDSEEEKLLAEKDEIESREDNERVTKTNSVSMPLCHEAMPSGITMLHKMTLKSVSAAEAGLFVAAWNHFLKAKPHVGQHESLGYGLLQGQYDVFLTPAGNVDPFAIEGAQDKPLGTLTAEPVSGLTGVPSELVGFMSAFKDKFAAGKFDFRVASEAMAEDIAS